MTRSVATRLPSPARPSRAGALLALCSSQVTSSVALAACAIELPADVGDTIVLQVTPAGEFRPTDGRAMPVPAWRMNAAIASRVIARFSERRTPPVLDYEHQTLLKETNGQPAPAAGWFRNLEWREGQGLYATVDLTARARAAIAAREYLYFSPVLRFDTATGDVLSIEMGALTNTPALDGMEPLAQRAAASFLHDHTHTQETPDMKTLLAAAIAALGLPAAVDESAAIEALNAVGPQLDELKALRKALGVPEDQGVGAGLAACSALATRATVPDPAKFVPVSVVDALKTEVAALTTRVATHDDAALNQVVEAALADGRLLAAQKDWALGLGKSDRAALNAYLASATPLPALRGSQTRGRVPEDGGAGDGLTADELAVCSLTGLSPEDFKKQRTALAALNAA